MKFFLRIITNTISGNIADRMTMFLDEFSNNIDAVNYSIIKSLKPYWKVNGYGEMLVELNTVVPLEKLKNILGSGWDDDTIDERRGTIYCDDIAFIWIIVS